MLDLNEKRSIFFWCCRSRKGAWIEITYAQSLDSWHLGRSRKGAWIEIYQRWIWNASLNVAPARERGLKYYKSNYKLWMAPRRSRKGAWIEIKSKRSGTKNQNVAPARERGLKLTCRHRQTGRLLSLPQGSVDWNNKNHFDLFVKF